jgi:hypothetical protein
LQFLPTIPSTNLRQLINQELTIVELRKTNSHSLADSAQNILYRMDYYSQFNYVKELNKLSQEIKYLINTESSDFNKRDLLDNSYYAMYKGNLNAIKLDLAINTNAKFANFDFLMFSKSSFKGNIFKEEDYGKAGLQLDFARKSFDSYMHCKLARVVDK